MAAEYKKKLIEVALPLEEINKESAREKSIRHGHPSTLHLWWARRPLAACRAVLFAQLVDDPEQDDLNPEYLELLDKLPIHKYKDQAKNQAEERRFKLFEFIERLVKWDNIQDDSLYNQAYALIKASCNGNPPPIYDPFSGGGSIPLEAQRLGLEAFGSDLNPVAVMIGKALIEIPPKFAGQPPVNPEAQTKTTKGKSSVWKGAKGLAEDVRYYGQWMRDEAFKRIGHLYPEVDLPDGGKATVIAWIWARNVVSPNPALSPKWGEAKWGESHWASRVPLASTFVLSSKAGKEAWIEPVISEDGRRYHYEVRNGKPPVDKQALIKNGTKSSRGANFTCLLSGIPITPDYIKTEGSEGRIDSELLAIVAEGQRGRIYLSPTQEMEEIAKKEKPHFIPDQELPNDPRNFWTPAYGLTTYGHLFTNRQLISLSTFSDLIVGNEENNIPSAHAQIKTDALASGLNELQANEYANAVSVYLAFGVDKLADRLSTISSWDSGYTKIRNTFGRQAIPMTWDFAEGNPFSDSTGNFLSCMEWTYKSIDSAPTKSNGIVEQKTAQEGLLNSRSKVVSTDPPYYDNIAYADLSDFFYIWLRRSLKSIYPDVFSTMMVPKAPELVATPYRHGGKENAEKFFMDGMTNAIQNIQKQQPDEYPVTIYYAFKQSERKDEGVASTGWATFLEAVIKAGFSINGTWPMRTELSNRMIASGTNALASSVVLVCRKQPQDAKTVTRKDFIQYLRRELPDAIKNLQHSNLAPVDMAQASIGPGMAIFSRYAKVMEADGTAMSVKTALQLINEELDRYLAEQEGEYDVDTRFAITWFEQFGMKEGEYGTAETLANTRGVSVQGVAQAGILTAKAGKVKLISRDDMPTDWDPKKDDRATVWEATQHLIRVAFANEGYNETAAAELLNKLGPLGESARDLAYRLYSVCERKKWADEALAYNNLVVAWPEILERASQLKQLQPVEPIQQTLMEV